MGQLQDALLVLDGSYLDQGKMQEESSYSLWIEAECWIPGQWTPDDDSTDVIVTWEGGKRRVASFITCHHV